MSTRSQDDHPSNGVQLTPKAVNSAIVQGKRKAQQGSDTTSEDSGKKRRRDNTASEDDIPLIDSIVDSNNADGKARPGADEEPSLGIIKSESENSAGATQRMVCVEILQKAEEPKQTVDIINPVMDMVSGFKELETPKHEPSLAKASKRTHKRFGSEEIESHLPDLNSADIIDAPIRQTAEDIVQLHSDEESEDEAPETVTAVNGFDQARTISAKTAEVVKKYGLLKLHPVNIRLTLSRQEAATKRKRRDRDERLKMQANLSKKRGVLDYKFPNTIHNSEDGTGENGSAHNQTDPETPSWSFNAPLPALLPDSVLSAKPPVIIPTSLTHIPTRNPTTKAKRKLLTSKPVKDLKHGSKTIRVLENSGGTLPPCVSKTSKALRDSWLSGQGFVPRRKLGGGFVRK